MRIRILAAETMGVRSLATVVEAGGLKIFIDPGASLAPRRYGLPPHPVELERLEESLERIREELRDSQGIIITHYHYDHYLPRPEDAELYRGKTLFVKHPTSSINVSQRIRAYRFLRKNGVEELADRVIYMDSAEAEVEGVKLVFSEPVPHGPEGTKLGYVVMVLVEAEGRRLAFTSDVQGPMSRRALDILVSWRPHTVVLGGPPTYFEGFKVPVEHVERGLRGMELLAETPGLEELVVDHHLTRDINYRERISGLLDKAGKLGVKVFTAAEYMGVREELLEARRRELWRR